MIFVVKAIGIILLVVGAIFAAKPALMRAFIDFAKVDKRYYAGGVIRIICGALLLASIPKVAFPWVTGAVGGLMLIGGVLLFVIGERRVHGIMEWFLSKKDDVLRVFPVIGALIGVVLIYAA